MAVTFRQLINRVLRVLGEDEIADSATQLSTQYHRLVATFVNQIKEEVEDSWNWRKLRTRITATVPIDGVSTALTGTNERSRVYREYDEVSGVERALVIDITNPGSEFPLREMDLARILYLNTTVSTSRGRFIEQFAIDDTSGDTVELATYPRSDVARTIQVDMIVPQDRIGDDELDTVIKVPTRPIELGALWYALEERGEELGVNGVFSEEKYKKALDDAISRDAAEQGGINLVPV